jgi:hypothetical protein
MEHVPQCFLCNMYYLVMLLCSCLGAAAGGTLTGGGPSKPKGLPFREKGKRIRRCLPVLRQQGGGVDYEKPRDRVVVITSNKTKFQFLILLRTLSNASIF